MFLDADTKPKCLSNLPLLACEIPEYKPSRMFLKMFVSPGFYGVFMFCINNVIYNVLGTLKIYIVV